MRLLSRLTLCIVAAVALTCCTSSEKPKKSDSDKLTPTPNCNSIYHWKSTFNLNENEVAFLQKHDLGRIYVKMFDVVLEYDNLNGKGEIIVSYV